MATTTPLTGTPIPQASDNIIDLLEVADLGLWLEKYVIARFASAAARDAAIPVPEWGMVAAVGSTTAARVLTFYTGSEWIVVNTRGQKAWRFDRVSANATDNFAAAAFAGVASGTITGAPAGDYLVTANAVWAVASGTAIGNIRINAAATNLSADLRADRQTLVGSDTFSAPYYHAGGDLTISLSLQVATGTGVVYKAGTHISAAYLGPR